VRATPCALSGPFLAMAAYFCKLTYLLERSIIMSMDKFSAQKRAHVVRYLVDSATIRATARITGIAKHATTTLRVDRGYARQPRQNKATARFSLQALAE